MIKNYLKAAFRNIKTYSTSSILNIIGMAVGMACAILLLLWVQNEFSYDRFYKNAGSLFRVLHTVNMDGGSRRFAITQYPLATTLKEECPEVVRASRFTNEWTSFAKDNNIIGGTVARVDNDFPDMFSISFISGDRKTALSGPYNIVITEDMAKRYFGREDPVGKTMKALPNRVFTVTGVIKNYPRNSHFLIDCLVSSDFLKADSTANPDDFTNWLKVTTATFVELAKGADQRSVEQKITDIVKEKMKGSVPKINSDDFFLQNIKKIHLYSKGKYEFDIEPGSIVYVRLAILLAAMMLAIACINFMNLTTALSARRTKEIGIRKAAGASKKMIIMQFMGESLMLVFFAHVLAMILVELFLPGFGRLLFTKLDVAYKNPVLYVGLSALMLTCTIIGGSYPSLFMASVKPANILKGNDDKRSGKSRLRSILVTFQFTITFIFIICTLIVKSQLSFLQNKETGLALENTCHFEFYGINQQLLKRSLLNDPDITAVTFTSQNPNYFWNSRIGFSWEGKKPGEEVQFNVLNTDPDFIKTFPHVLVRGRYLSDDFSGDRNGLVINERAAKAMGLSDPVGKIITWNDINLNIVGVLKDFHYGSLHYPIEPLFITNLDKEIMKGVCNVRMRPGTMNATLEYIRAVYKSNNFDYPLDFKFIDDDYKIMYPIERAAGSMFGYLSVLAMLISCLGLIGLSIFLTLRRTKEIGIRKASGANSGEILAMFIKEYLRLILISFVIACPVSWYATNIWLRSYAYRINVGPEVFVISLILVILITLITVGYQSYKAATKNPVDALRYE